MPAPPLIIIPARMAASRLPNKPLLDIGGLPMIVRVWQQAVAADIGQVFVAAGEQAICDAISQAGGQAIMTDPNLPSGSDRVYQAILATESQYKLKSDSQQDKQQAHDIIINLQGDLPILPANALHALVACMTDGVEMATLVAQITDPEQRDDPNCVKAIISWDDETNRTGRALYFTRLPAPYGEGAFYQHIGIYAYRRATLARFVGLPVSALERRERLEQLRALEAGMHIQVARIDEVPFAVDTPADLEKARQLLGS
ncbi:MAG: 3-deoxy-manno-octulosonate cytidylyltransferase [Alphaproteobacteria bacterium]|nr:3-deoxy-manno-octulosonate cytidylyltransferase [Alphaproteobacteria bacterium]